MTINRVSGEIRWNTPKQIGEYCFAVKIGEWKNNVMIGYVIRDFQVIVYPVDGGKPEFSGVQPWAKDSTGNFILNVAPGDSLSFDFLFNNPDASSIKVEGYSEAFHHSNSGIKTVTSNYIHMYVNWKTETADARCQPYIFTFRAFSRFGSKGDFAKDLTVLLYIKSPSTLCTAPILGLKEISNAGQLTIFPNPSNGIFQLNLNNLPQTRRVISIYNVLGEKVYETQSLTEQTEIDLSAFDRGIYFVKLACGAEVYNQKVIVN